MNKSICLFKRGNFLVPLVILLFPCIGLSQAAGTQSEFKPSGKIWGYAFGDFFYKSGGLYAAGPDSFFVNKGDTTIKVKRFGDAEFAKIPKDYYAFTFRRIYLGYDYQFTQNLSSRILLEGNDGVLTSGGDRTVFIKALYLEWKNFLPKQTLKLGQISTPTWSTFTEKQWGYRPVEKSICDLRKIGRSNDVGIGLEGTIYDLKTDAGDSTQKAKSVLNITYNAMMGNGAGSKPETNYAKVFYGELIFKIMGAFFLDVYAEYDYSDNQYAGGPTPGKHYSTAKTIYKGCVGYENEFLTAGVESVQMVQKNVKVAQVDSATGTKKDTSDFGQMGLSFWARGSIVKDKLYAFARYDLFNSDAFRRGWEYYKKDSDARRYDETLFIVGVDWRPAKNLQVMPNLWINSYRDMSSNEVDFLATGPKEYQLKPVSRNADLVPRVTLFFKF